jgi:hypothetical protein
MNLNEIQLREMEQSFPGLKLLSEGGFNYIFVPQVILPSGCTPEKCDVLLCPQVRDGYQSRLFFASQVAGGPTRNWNSTVRILDRTWYAFSWQTTGNHSFLQMLMIHLNALRNDA